MNGQLKGWQTGAYDGVQSWGQNVVSGIYTDPQLKGDTLRFAFDRNGIPNEGAMSGGDSGGGVFIQQGGTWKLAAVNYATDSPWSLTGDPHDPGFNGALLDAGGLYAGGNYDPNTGTDQWTAVPDTQADQPGSSYSSRISTKMSFINSILARDYPMILAIYLLFAFVISVANLTVDLAYGLLDPRIKVSR